MIGTAALLYKTKYAEKAQEIENRRSENERMHKMWNVVWLRHTDNVPCLLCDHSSTTSAPDCFWQHKGVKRGGEELMLGQFHLWPLFILSPSNRSSLQNPLPQTSRMYPAQDCNYIMLQISIKANQKPEFLILLLKTNWLCSQKYYQQKLVVEAAHLFDCYGLNLGQIMYASARKAKVSLFTHRVLVL